MTDGFGARSEYGLSQGNHALSAALTWYFPNLPAVKGWRDFVIAMCNKLPMAMRDSASPAILRRSIMGSTADRIKDIGPQPQSFDIERATKENTNYRSVAWSGRYLQATLMSIPVGGDIGLEAHPETDQFLRLEAGSGRVQMGAAKDKLTFEKEVSDGWCVLVPAGTWHNITNIGATPMQVYAIYAPAHHTPDKVQATAAAAEADKDDKPAAWSVQPKHAPDKHG
jgi:mannose-6-phosphate isomerase-like protein (cupin superfamily)